MLLLLSCFLACLFYVVVFEPDDVNSNLRNGGSFLCWCVLLGLSTMFIGGNECDSLPAMVRKLVGNVCYILNFRREDLASRNA